MDLPPPLEPEYAPLGHRVGARLVDVVVHYGVIFYAVVWISMLAAIVVPERMDAITAKLGENTFFGVILGVLGSVLYHTCMEGIHGSSIGKRLFGLTVLNAEGGPCSLWQGWKRSLAFLLDSFFFGMVGYGAAKSSPMKQRVGDDWAGTVVVRTRSVPASFRRSGKELFAAFSGGFACDFILVALGLTLGYLVG